jgi:hypothetical protein
MGDPFLDEGLKRWIINKARKEHWRISSWYDLADLIQDGYLCYAKCRRRYTFLTTKNHPGPDDKRRFMALLKAAFTNHIHTLSNKRCPELSEAWLVHSDGAPMTLEECAPVEEAGAELAAQVAALPEHLLALIAHLSSLDDGMYKRERHSGRHKLRETTEENVRRMLGLPESSGIFAELTAHL